MARAQASIERPGGLTALAILNFLFAAYLALGVLGLLVLLFGGSFLAKAEQEMEAQGVSRGVLLASLANSVVAILLLVLSGIGYLGQRRVLGRLVGTLYALAGLLGTGAVMILMGTFQMAQLISLVYPLMVLFLVNMTFRYDLVH